MGVDRITWVFCLRISVPVFERKSVSVNKVAASRSGLRESGLMTISMCASVKLGQFALFPP